MTHATVLPQKLAQSNEWRATMLLLNSKPLRAFCNSQYINLEQGTIDFPAMRKAAVNKSTLYLIYLAAHLFNCWNNKMLPGEELLALDYENKCYALLALMVRHGVKPEDVLRLSKKTEVMQ